MRPQRFATLCLFLCTSKLVYAGVDDLGANISAIAYTYCPISEFCKSGMDQPPLGVKSCCEPCSCDEDCYIGQRCCPDSGFDQSKKYNVSISCRPIDELFNVNRTVSDDFFHSEPEKGYYVIDYCPADFPDDDVIEGCLAPRTIREHVFVTDARSTLIYKNYQCAICNDIIDYETWDLRLICTYSDSLYSVQKDDNAILDHCYVYPQPAPLSPSRKWACNTMYIDTCNVTGQWDVQDDVIAEACATFNIPYTDEIYDPFDGFVIISDTYRNVYCFLCNKKTGGAHVKQMCIFPEISYPTILGVPFKSILDMTAYESAQTHEELDENQCTINQMPDPLTGECVTILCPFGQTPFFGNCNLYMDQIDLSFTVIYGFQFTATNGAPLPEQEPTSTLMYISLLSTIQSLFQNARCTYCRIEISSDAFLVQAIPSDQCRNEYMLALFQELTKLSQLTGVFGQERFEVNIWITTKYSMTKEPNRVSFDDLVKVRKDIAVKCANAVQLSPKFFCKRIQFSPLDVANNGMSNGTIDSVLAKSEIDVYMNDTGLKYAICVDDYIGITNKGTRIGIFQFALFVMPIWLLLVN